MSSIMQQGVIVFSATHHDITDDPARDRSIWAASREAHTDALNSLELLRDERMTAAAWHRSEARYHRVRSEVAAARRLNWAIVQLLHA